MAAPSSTDPSPIAAVTPWPRALRWVARAWSRFGWRDVALAYGLVLVSHVIGPSGAYFFFPGTTNPTTSIVAGLLSGHYLSMFLPMMFFARVADAAVEDGAPTFGAYVAAWISGSIVGPSLNYSLSVLLDTHRSTPSFWMLTLLLQGGAGLWAYAYWRISQRAHRVVLAVEAERVRTEQAVHAAQLMALQARVDPALLFDTLTRVGELHERDHASADRMLDELIVLLRSMLPGRSLIFSTIEREARLVDAWLRVAAHTSSRTPAVTQQVPAGTGDEPMPAMVMVHLVQCAISAFVTERSSWIITYWIQGPRLHVRLFPTDEDRALQRHEPASRESTQRRLIDALGADARFRFTTSPPRLEFDLPRGASRP